MHTKKKKKKKFQESNQANFPSAPRKAKEVIKVQIEI